jgi:hypothetical protein
MKVGREPKTKIKMYVMKKGEPAGTKKKEKETVNGQEGDIDEVMGREE